MSNPCEITQPHYLRALLQLLPRGYAWEWDENSAGRGVLAAMATELHRAHETLCGIANYNIERFAEVPQGWSAPDYERLLLTKFGITATVFDSITLFGCESPCDSAAVFDPRIAYVFVIAVDDVALITPVVLSALREYKQSHTDFVIASRAAALADGVLHIDWTIASSRAPDLVVNLADLNPPANCRRDDALH